MTRLHISKLIWWYILVLDYDTHETVTCVSHYIYDSERQRSLQHFLRIEGLPAKFKQVDLPSGIYAACGIQVRLQRKQMQFLVQVRKKFRKSAFAKFYVLGVSSKFHVCCYQLGQLSHQTRSCSWKVKDSIRVWYPLFHKAWEMCNLQSLI